MQDEQARSSSAYYAASTIMAKIMISKTTTQRSWYPLSYALFFMCRHLRLLVWSFLLFVITVAITTFCYQLTTNYVDTLSGSYFATSTATDTIWGWLQDKLFFLGRWLYLVITRVVAFYLAFAVAYSLTTPGYIFLSTATEKIHEGNHFNSDDAISLRGFLRDLLEGIKIAILGLLVTALALTLNLLPGLGQGAVFLLYVFYSALLFIDYPASRRRWSLGKKLVWLRVHVGTTLRLGLLPAFISMIPIINIFLLSLIFPLLTISATLNFNAKEGLAKPAQKQPLP